MQERAYLCELLPKAGRVTFALCVVMRVFWVHHGRQEQGTIGGLKAR
jgi:hypothetical protein